MEVVYPLGDVSVMGSRNNRVNLLACSSLCLAFFLSDESLCVLEVFNPLYSVYIIKAK